MAIRTYDYLLEDAFTAINYWASVPKEYRDAKGNVRMVIVRDRETGKEYEVTRVDAEEALRKFAADHPKTHSAKMLAADDYDVEVQDVAIQKAALGEVRYG